jgi:hypothetical protein
MNTAQIKNTMQQNWQYIVIGLLSLALVVVGAVAVMASNDTEEQATAKATTGNHENADPKQLLEEHGITPLTTAEASNNAKAATDLTYIIEEEKLAHDVYQAMYDKWGSRIFGNIKNSETSHQGMVLAVMESRGLADPRTDTLGTFTNPDLQALYDKLISQGSQSQAEAYKVGVIIEEVDIADLKRMIAALDPADSDIKDVYENLLHGSENHLRAFSRQVAR